MSDVITEFNSSAATLERIDRALRLAADAAVNSDFRRWFQYLDIAMREVYPKLKSDERDSINDNRKRLSKMIILLNGNANKSQQFYNKIADDLLHYELFLRDSMDKKGMLMKNKDAASTALSRG